MDNIYHQYWQQELMYQLASADRYRKRAYVCSPFRADTREQCEKNLRTARAYMFYANKKMNMNAAAPHAYLPLLLCDEIPAERAIALRFGLEILEEIFKVYLRQTAEHPGHLFQSAAAVEGNRMGFQDFHRQPLGHLPDHPFRIQTGLEQLRHIGQGQDIVFQGLDCLFRSVRQQLDEAGGAHLMENSG